MDTKSKSISLVPVLRFLAVLITVAGVLLACYGLIEGPNFQYAFQPEAYADSLEEGHNLQSGFHWVMTLRDNSHEEWVYQHALDKLTTPHPYLYYVDAAGEASITNIGNVPNVEEFFSGLSSYRKSSLSDGVAVYVGFSSETYSALAEDYLVRRAKGIEGFYFAIAGMVATVLGLGYVMYTAGDQPNSTEVRLSFLDGLYLDVGLVIFVGVSALAISGLFELWRLYDRDQTRVTLVLGGLLAVFASLVGLQYASSVAKRLKRGEFFKHTLIYASLAWVFSVMRRAWNGTVGGIQQTGSLAVRAAGLLIGYSVMSSIALLLLFIGSRDVLEFFFCIGLFGVVNLAALMYVVRRASELKTVMIGTERIKGGDLSTRIPEKGSADFVTLASSINNIAMGLQAAVESEVKSERMKAELVTNVSHDLKTPLTSIITYVDLLKTEGLSSDNAAKYLDVLDKKSQRLKVLTEDLFEAAKAASGNLSLKREQLDVGSLLTQGLAELSDRIEGSGLDFRVNIPVDKLHVQADGKLLWRAIENVLSNALNYALVGSRVYIEAIAKGNQVYMTFKNISASPLNIEPEELVERFKRGDESRSTEGSGLGLAIAKSLLELQGGTFKIEIDGDLFKVTMALPESK